MLYEVITGVERMMHQETQAEGINNYMPDPALLCTPPRVEMNYNLLDPTWLSRQAEEEDSNYYRYLPTTVAPDMISDGNLRDIRCDSDILPVFTDQVTWTPAMRLQVDSRFATLAQETGCTANHRIGDDTGEPIGPWYPPAPELTMVNGEIVHQAGYFHYSGPDPGPAPVEVRLSYNFV